MYVISVRVKLQERGISQAISNRKGYKESDPYNIMGKL